MPYSRRLLLSENCFISPICLSTSVEEADLVVHSQKLSERLELTRITVLFVVDESILHETVVDLPLSRLTVPARLLSAVASVTIHLAVCDVTGVADVIDSGQVLVLPPDPARELQQVFEQMALDVQDSFYSPSTNSSHADRYRQHSSVWSHLLPAHAPVSADSAAAVNGSTVGTARTVSAVEARRAALYAYQHLLLPVVHLMSAVLQGAAAHHLVSTSHRETAALQNIARRLLDFLVDNDMFESALYFMAQLPFAPEDAMGNRLQLFHSLAGHSNMRALALQQQLLMLQMPQQHTADSLQQPQRNNIMPVMHLQEHAQQHSGDLAARGASAAATAGQQVMLQQRSCDESSVPSADEILRQLGALGQVKFEQEALESELLLQQELDALDSAHALQQQQLEQHLQSRAVFDDLEGYLQPHPSLIRWTVSQRTPTAVQQLPGLRQSTRGGSLELPRHLHQPVLVPMQPVPLSSTAAGAGAARPQGVQQQRAGTLGAAVADGQRLQLHLLLEPGLPAVMPAAPAAGWQLQQREQVQVQQQQPQPQQCAPAERMQLAPVSAVLHSQAPAMQLGSPSSSSGSGSFESIEGLPGQQESEVVADSCAAQADMRGNTDVDSSNQVRKQDSKPHLDQPKQQQQQGPVWCGSKCGGSSSIRTANSQYTQQNEVIRQASCSSSTAAGSTAAAADASDKSPFNGFTTAQQVRALAKTSVNGFDDQHQEQAFLMFKNHTAGLLDITAGVICIGILVAASLRSFNTQEPLAWPKLAAVLVYGLAFFSPYAFMHLKQQAFLRFREPLIVWARVLSSFVLALVGLGAVGRPDEWVAASGICVTMYLIDGFILPCCQQVRVPAACVIAAAQFIADACLLQIEFAPWIAVLQAACIQSCALLVGLWLDAWGRRRFMLRNRGMLGGICERRR